MCLDYTLEERLLGSSRVVCEERKYKRTSDFIFAGNLGKIKG